MSLLEVKEALTKQGVLEADLTLGDAILFNFGWWRNWKTDFVTDDTRYPRIRG